jgi:hypothetical protein
MIDKIKSCILITHQFVNSGEEFKIDIFKSVLEYHKKYNPGSFIILTGHGKRPPDEVLQIADYVYWSDVIIEGEINKGFPKLVTIGLNKAKELGYNYVCKTRLDSIIMVPELLKICHKKLLKSGKAMINTHYYLYDYLLMDLFNYGPVDLLISLYNPKKWVVPWNKSGMGPMAKNYLDYFNLELKQPFDPQYWEECVLKNTLIMTPKDLKWIDFRAFPDIIINKKKDIMNNTLVNYEQYLWKH